MKLSSSIQLGFPPALYSGGIWGDVKGRGMVKGGFAGRNAGAGVSRANGLENSNIEIIGPNEVKPRHPEERR